MTNFWLQFAIAEAVGVANAVVATDSKITPAQKAALEALIVAGQGVAASFAG